MSAGRVCVLYTGGTFGTRTSKPELQPEKAEMLALSELKAILPGPEEVGVDYDLCPVVDAETGRTMEPIISSKIVPEDWRRLARMIADHYEEYNGFVVLHGTDTLAWTASALSFMFDNLAKPIVFTGSQRPILDVPTDAIRNFTNSVLLAGRGHSRVPPISEVVICFGDRILRGNRSQKVSASSWQGFDTPNVDHIGRVGRTFDVDAARLRPPPDPRRSWHLRSGLERRIVDVMMFPGMRAEQLSATLAGSAGGVLRTFGAGNAPGDDDLLRVLSDAADQGKVLVNVTQCAEGTVESGMLTGSRRLTDYGVLSGLDMTPEAAFTKLMVLMGNYPARTVRPMMQIDLRGEQSIDLVEMKAKSGMPEGLRARAILTDSLSPRSDPSMVGSCVLRLRNIKSLSGDPVANVSVYLNRWHSGPGDEDSGAGRLSVRPQGGALTGDVTAAFRSLAAVAEPVTLTTLSDVPIEYDAYLSVYSLNAPSSHVSFETDWVMAGP